MTRNQQIAFMSVIIMLFAVMTIGVIANSSAEPTSTIGNAEWVDNYVEANAPTIPQCYVNYGEMTYQVDCNSQSMVDSKKRYDRKVQHDLEMMKKHL